MNPLAKIARRINFLYRHHVIKDPFTQEVSRWFADKGDETLRLDYDLDEDSVVFDLGGYVGDFAFEINKRYGSKVYIFEPVTEFYNVCLDRFKDNKDIDCYNFGLSSRNERRSIGLSANASSFFSPVDGTATEDVEVRSIIDFIQEKRLPKIGLLKINIEGGEYDVLDSLINCGWIRKIEYLQIQFHDFIDGAVRRRLDIRESLSNSHEEMWCYEFVWESWKLKQQSQAIGL